MLGELIILYSDNFLFDENHTNPIYYNGSYKILWKNLFSANVFPFFTGDESPTVSKVQIAFSFNMGVGQMSEGVKALFS